MVYITFPRNDLNDHPDLDAWRKKLPKTEGDWKALRGFLAEQSRLWPQDTPYSKCWYSEIYQLDNYALDVEHFRPKNSASPLNIAQEKYLTKMGVVLLQDSATGSSYHWLAHDYRNYRLATALTNRAGAKHIYFPIFDKTPRLSVEQNPWIDREYPLLLDPTNKHDAKQLLVRPGGEIVPFAPKTILTATHIAQLPHSWESDAFNYVRAQATIMLFRLNEKVFIEGRKETYKDAQKWLDEDIRHAIEETGTIGSKTVMTSVNRLKDKLLPSAMFSLAARSALMAYMPKTDKPTLHFALAAIAQQLLQEIEKEQDKLLVDWTKP